ncbi:MAG: zf-HC2 domain-containing protein [Planctomycetota bacterium]|nr:zf-HC2 domain-containing protein [Planctomycetota bacterium]
MPTFTPSQPARPVGRAASRKPAPPPECLGARESFRGYAEGSLSMNEARALEAHLAACAGCAAELANFRRLYQLMDRTLGQRRLTQDFDRRAELALRETPSTGKRGAVPFTVPAGANPRTAETADQDGVNLETSGFEELDVPGAPVPGFLDNLQANLGAAPWWVISGAFHALLLLLLTLIGMALMRANEDQTVIVTDLQEKREEPEPPEQVKRDIFRKPVPVEASEVSVETPIVTHEEVEIADHVETANESDAADTRGEDGMSDVFLGGTGTVASIGLGGGGGGAFGRPNGAGGRLRRALKGGGGQATESAVDKALDWLARNQEPDGSWDTVKHEGKDTPPPNVGATGLALLAFLGAGHTEKVGKYKETVRKAQEWLISQQVKDGKEQGMVKSPFRGGGYCHGIAGLALAEAAAMARNPKVKEAAQLALNYSCEVHQNGAGSERLGWRYNAKQVGDTSVTGWFIMQLKSAKIAGLQIDPASFEGAQKYLNSVEIDFEKVKNDPYAGGRFKYQTEGHTGASINSVGMLASLFLGRQPDSLQGGVEVLMKDLPEWKPNSGGKHGIGGGHAMYYWYYGTLAMFQVGGEEWKKWNEAMKAALLPHQRVGGPEDGSWDPLATEGVRGGRVVCTALGVLSLEVYYRYLPMYRE